jgi:hypothetical protein
MFASDEPIVRQENLMKWHAVVWLFVTLLIAQAAVAQQSAQNNAGTVPRLIPYSGVATDVTGKPLSGVVGITFLLYQQEDGDAPLWLETQNVQADGRGRYSVQLGATLATGIPGDLFASGEARWLAVQISGQAESARVMLLSVPYALKAADAETIGGLPASAFVLANSAQAGTSFSRITPPASTGAIGAANSSAPSNPNVTGKGTVDFIPMWDTTSDIISSVIFQKNSEIGIATTTPTATLDVNGKTDLRDVLTLFPKSADNTLAVNGTAFKINSTGLVTFISGQTFPGTGTITGITTASGSGLSGGGTSGTLSLNVPAAGITNTMLKNSSVTLNANSAGGLTTPGAMALGSTYTMGLKPCAANQILENNGSAWNCANVSTGTVTSVGSGLGLTGGPITNSGTLMINTTVVPQLSVANTFTGNQTVNGNVSATGLVTGSAFNIGSNPFAFGSYANGNASLGFGGNLTSTGGFNTAVGFQALLANSSGSENIATGYGALGQNTSGSNNTASGGYALHSNTTGGNNTAVGIGALQSSTGMNNTAIGSVALETVTSGGNNSALGTNAGSPSDLQSMTGSNNTFVGANTAPAGANEATLSNATAIGANAQVAASNGAIVLGSINGVNAATASANVGIGTTAPTYLLHIGNTGGSANNNFLRVEGPTVSGTGGLAASFGGWGTFQIDAVGIPGGRLLVTESGQVGIGTNNPDSFFTVNGTADKPGGGSWGTYSDRRLKTLNGRFNSGLNQVLKLNPVRYRYKNDNAMGIHDPEEHVGLVAQEVQRAIPEAVTKNKKGYLLVNNDPII